MSEGFEPLKAEKVRVLKFKRVQAIKLLCFPPVVFLTVFKICSNFKAVSVALREVCLVKIPELWYFCSNQWFLFLLTNVLVITLAYLSGSLAPSNGNEAIYEEFVRRSEAARKYNASRPVSGKKQTSSQTTSFRRKNSGELRKRRSSECPETQQQTQASEAKSLIAMEVPCPEPATIPAEELQRRPEAEALIVTEVPSTESATVSAEELQRSEAKPLILMELPSTESETVSAEELQSTSEANSWITPCEESATLPDEKFDEFIAKFHRGRIKEESSAYYREMARLIVM
ncbi:hypothetical protein SUGI_0961170 [Cryptomeria japonica]|nr:hypothetical protein SUGI_0961170 [Cryptomeria japonica]